MLDLVILGYFKPSPLIFILTNMTISFSKNFSSILGKTTAILAISSGVFSFVNVPVKAGGSPNYMIVTEPRGINIRNRNCEVIDSLGFGQLVQKINVAATPDTGAQITCKVGGKDLTMIRSASINGGNYDLINSYVALDYLDPVIDGIKSFDINKSSVITGEYGANLRDSASCSRVAIAPKGTKMDANPKAPSLAVCQVGSEFYLMRQPVYQGKAYFVADILINNI